MKEEVGPASSGNVPHGPALVTDAAGQSGSPSLPRTANGSGRMPTSDKGVIPATDNAPSGPLVSASSSAEDSASHGSADIAREPLPSTQTHHPALGSHGENRLVPERAQEAQGTTSQGSSSGSAVVSILVGAEGGRVDPALPAGELANTDDAPTVITRPAGAGQGAASGRPPLAGRRLGHFELLEAIGSGGMAAVIKARDLELGRMVALKILPPEAAQDTESIARFKQEARAAALLDHENIARVYFCGEDQGLHFIAFEFVEGDNLRTLIERRGPLPAAECVHYLLQVAAGLHHAWERGVVHRDIKPSNIIITPDGRAKIVDMGLARLYDASFDGGMTQSGVTLGTFDYISPEQALDPRRTDVRSDIYSLGCTFYHALTGRPPVAEGTAASKLYAHQHVEPIDPRVLNPSIPDELALILARMMAKDPARRYQTPLELIADLKGLAERLQLRVDTTDTAVQVTPGTAELLPRSWPVHPLWFGLLTAAVLLLAVTVWQAALPSPAVQLPTWAVPEGGPPPVPPRGPDRPTVGPLRPPIAESETVQVHTVEELLQALRQPRVRQIVLAAGEYDLSRVREALVTRTSRLEIIGVDPTQTRLRVRALPWPVSSTRTAPPGSWTIVAESFTARRLLWEFVEPAADEAKDSSAAAVGLLLKEVAEVHLQDCLCRSRLPMDLQVATIALLAGDAGPPRVYLERCLVATAGQPRGGTGLLLPAGSRVQVEDSGFGPHLALFRLLPLAEQAEGEAESPPAAFVQLSRSSFLIDRRSVVVQAASPCRVEAGYCVFALPGVPARSEQAGVLLAAPALSGISYAGSARNAYFAVQPLAVGPDGMQRLWSWEECRAAGLPCQDAHAVRLSRPPWSESRPLQRLETAEPWPAFRLRIDQEPALLVRDRIKVIGAQFRDEVRGYRAYPQLVAFPSPPPEGAPASTGPRTLIWQPHPPPGEPLPPGTATDLTTLIRQARPDDTILIRHDGLLLFDHTELLDLRARNNGGSEFKLTFKPYPKSRPVLTIDPANRSLDQFLFQLRGGEVEFVELQFLLRPSLPQNGLQTAAALSLLHGRGCSFDRCVFTLLEEGEARATVVHAGDPEKIMAMDGMPRPTPTVRFVNCLIRGKGRGVWLTGGRALQCEWSNTLLAIQGPVYFAEGTSRPVSGEATLRWNRCTALLAGPLIELQGYPAGEMRTTGLPRLTVETEGCLFVAAPNAARPLVELHHLEGEVKNLLTWQTRQGNRYANFDPSAVTLLYRPAAETAMPREWDWEQWLAFAAEPPLPQRPLGTVTWNASPQKLQEPARLTPADLRVRSVQFPDLDSTDPTELPAGLLRPADLPDPFPSDPAPLNPTPPPPAPETTPAQLPDSEN
ncbi:MAG: serine/threonine-protein kinase [Thermogemmata sp.]|nr:serine/threonine-protein kinase [Thermogemmata sp.]